MSITVSNCSEVRQRKSATPKNTSFGYNVILDVGASYAGGNVKARWTTNNGQDLFVKNVHIKNSTNGFKSKDEFTKGLSKIISDSDKTANAKLNDLGLTQDQLDKEKKLSGFCLLIPGQVLGQKALLMANLKTQDKKSLEKVYLSDIVSDLKQNKDLAIADDFNFIAAKDLAGTGRDIAAKLAKSETYKHKFEQAEIDDPNGDGKFKACVVMTGGGYGAVDIKVVNDQFVIIETSESSHNLSVDPTTKTIERIGKLGASKNSIIENFAEKMGYSTPEEINTLCLTGNAKMVTQERIKLDSVHQTDAIQLLTQNGDYNIIDNKGKETVLELNSEDENVVNRFKEARKYAVEEYADAIAQSAVPKVNSGFHLMILTGPMAMGLDKTVQQNQDDFKTESLSKLVMNKLDDYVGNDYTCRKLREAHNFEVVCNEEFDIKDNTEGGAEFLKDPKGTYNNMDELLTVPISELKKSQ